METLRIFIGYDPRDDAAHAVCRSSLLQTTSVPLSIQALRQPALRHAGLYRRAAHHNTMIDSVDGKPFSTEFSFTRFLVPALCQYEGWALFVDSDFLFMADVADLFAAARENLAVMCIHHDHRPPERRKMDGMAQEIYPRKNWSSLMLLNCGHLANRELTPDVVSNKPGAWLHGLKWINDPWLIGELPEAWNWLCGHSPRRITPKAVHFTRGTPDMAGHEDEPFADEWRAVWRRLAPEYAA